MALIQYAVTDAHCLSQICVLLLAIRHSDMSRLTPKSCTLTITSNISKDFRMLSYSLRHTMRVTERPKE